MTKIFHIGGLISFIGLGIMILTGMTSIGAILADEWELLKRCPLCMCDPSMDTVESSLNGRRK